MRYQWLLKDPLRRGWAYGLLPRLLCDCISFALTPQHRNLFDSRSAADELCGTEEPPSGSLPQPPHQPGAVCSRLVWTVGGQQLAEPLFAGWSRL